MEINITIINSIIRDSYQSVYFNWKLLFSPSLKVNFLPNRWFHPCKFYLPCENFIYSRYKWPKTNQLVLVSSFCSSPFLDKTCVKVVTKTKDLFTSALSYWLHCCCCSVTQSCPTLCDPMDCSTPGLPVPHHLPEFAQHHVHCIGDAVQPSHPLTPSSPSALNFSQHQELFQWAVCLYHMTKILELQLQHQFFQWIFRTDFP